MSNSMITIIILQSVNLVALVFILLELKNIRKKVGTGSILSMITQVALFAGLTSVFNRKEKGKEVELDIKLTGTQE